MTTFLFWNIFKQPISDLIVQLSHNHDVDILILAESSIPDNELLAALNKHQKGLYRRSDLIRTKVSIYSRYSPERIDPVGNPGGLSIRHLQDLNLLLIAAHLPSRLFFNDRDQASRCRRLAREISAAEQKVGHSRTILVGDLNMNPFDEGVIEFEGLHAIMDRRIAMRKTRQVEGEERKFFYNPMWNHFGDTFDPPGTYYYDNTGKAMNFFWNVFDQVLIRPELLYAFSNEDLKIITRVDETSLVTEHGIPNKDFSDHLPILFQLRL